MFLIQTTVTRHIFLVAGHVCTPLDRSLLWKSHCNLKLTCNDGYTTNWVKIISAIIRG